MTGRTWVPGTDAGWGGAPAGQESALAVLRLPAQRAVQHPLRDHDHVAGLRADVQHARRHGLAAVRLVVVELLLRLIEAVGVVSALRVLVQQPVADLLGDLVVPKVVLVDTTERSCEVTLTIEKH